MQRYILARSRAPLLGLGIWFGITTTGSGQAAEGRIAGSVGGPSVGMIVMVSCIKDGKVFSQSEAQTGYNWGCPPGPEGIYEVRIEGDGIVTQVKRGIHIFAGQTTGLRFEVVAGAGVHIVEYATGGLSREVVAAQLETHGSELTMLQAQLAQTSGLRPPAAADPPCCTVIAVDETSLIGTAVVNGFTRRFHFKFESSAQLLQIKNRAQPTDMRTTGTVKWFNDAKGFIWSFAAQGKIGFTPTEPCCMIVVRP